MSDAQGVDYLKYHNGQHGGAAVSLGAAAPVGYTGMLDDSLRMAARVTPLDAAGNQILGLSDQSGGGKAKKKSAAFTRKMKALRKRVEKLMRSMTRRSGRKMRGGAAVGPMADYASPGMLLPPAAEAKALMGMNPEWKLAADPASFAPKMSGGGEVAYGMIKVPIARMNFNFAAAVSTLPASFGTLAPPANPTTTATSATDSSTFTINLSNNYNASNLPAYFVTAYTYNPTAGWVNVQRQLGAQTGVASGTLTISKDVKTLTFSNITRASNFPTTANDPQGFALYLIFAILN